jgi:hypothetical protein
MPIVHDNGKVTLMIIDHYLDDDDLLYHYRQSQVAMQNGRDEEHDHSWTSLKSFHGIDQDRKSFFDNVDLNQFQRQVADDDDNWGVKVTFKRLEKIPDSIEEYEAALEDASPGSFYSPDTLFSAGAEIDLGCYLDIKKDPVYRRIPGEPVNQGYVQLSNDHDSIVKNHILTLLNKARKIVELKKNEDILLESENDPTATLTAEIAEAKEHQAVQIKCTTCGCSVEGFDGSSPFIQCPSCQTYVDVVADCEEVNPQIIEADKLEDTILPIELFLKLFLQKYKLEEVETILSLISNHKLDNDYHNFYIEKLAFTSAITQLFHDKPYFLSRYKYSYNDVSSIESGRGSVVFIKFPCEESVHYSGYQEGTVSLEIPEKLRGKVVCISFGEHGYDPYNSDDKWYRVHTTIFDPKDLYSENGERISDINEWARVHFGTGQEGMDPQKINHWLQDRNIIVHKTDPGRINEALSKASNADDTGRPKINKEAHGLCLLENKIYTMIKDILELTPQNQNLERQLKTNS